jgi:hypothetical protein
MEDAKVAGDELLLKEADTVMVFIEIVVSAGVMLAPDVILPLDVLTGPAVVELGEKLYVVVLAYVGEQSYPEQIPDGVTVVVILIVWKMVEVVSVVIAARELRSVVVFKPEARVLDEFV